MKLEVGEIRMDSQAGIAFGEPKRSRPEPPPQRVEALVPSERVMYAAFALAIGVVACGASALVFAGVLPPVALVVWCMLPALGAAMIIRERSLHTEPEPTPGRLARDRAARLVEELSEGHGASVVELERRIGWSTEAVLDGLATAIASGQIEEDVDIDRGEYVYAVREEVILGLEVESASLKSVQERLTHALTTSSK